MFNDRKQNLVKTRVEELFIKHGFKPTNLLYTPEHIVFVHSNGLYCCVSFVRMPNINGDVKDCVLIEYAGSMHEAKNCMFDDGDMIPLEIPIKQILDELEKELVANIEGE